MLLLLKLKIFQWNLYTTMASLLRYALDFCTTKYFFFIKNNDVTIELNTKWWVRYDGQGPYSNSLHDYYQKPHMKVDPQSYGSLVTAQSVSGVGGYSPSSWREQIRLQQSHLFLKNMSLCSDLGTLCLFHLMPLLIFTSILCMLFTSLTVDNSTISYFWQYHSTVQVSCNKTYNMHIM